MPPDEIKTMLEHQLQYLSDRSAGCTDDHGLAEMSAVMVDIARLLLT